MPNLDGTGPQGQGAKTGRGLGNCTNQDNSLRNGCGRGCGCRRNNRRVNNQNNQAQK